MSFREKGGMAVPNDNADTGFHAGELAVQRAAGVADEASRLSPMLAPARFSAGFANFLAQRTFVVLAGTDTDDRLWASPLAGPPGFVQVSSPTQVTLHATPAAGDPLHDIRPGRKVAMTAIEFAARRRVRINGTLSHADTGTGTDILRIAADQAYGNCPQYITPRLLTPTDATENPGPRGVIRRDTALSAEDVALIRAADTFFLGTRHAGRGTDVSHRGGPAGFVRVDGQALWWPDYPGNNLFNSLGNLAVDPTAALLFFDFASGATLQLSGTAETLWGAPGPADSEAETGRVVRFTPQHLVAGPLLPARQITPGPERTLP
ncbi:putative pyridoxine 5'-phosphate oxidase superfamily flavin-nucleotide-binding protein [Catenulispora sp. GP43]|uniref:pyridoxamine 5'-phosphate oxidase family protein n=1 Tax=Catenulispora sp. GP43 TaxID=3156263 RepID=UPI003510D74D